VVATETAGPTVPTTPPSESKPRQTLAERNEPLSFDQSWPHTFPLLGSIAHKQKRRLQLPWGIGINYLYFSQPIVIEGLELSANDNPTEPIEFIKFGEVRGTGQAANFRLDWWVLPFLNVYGMMSYVRIATPVEVVEPIVFGAEVPFDAFAFGGGATVVGSMGPLFLSVDFNAQSTYIPKNKDSTTAFVTSSRLGYNHTFKKSRYAPQLTVWLGAMYTAITSGTEGSVNLSDVLPNLEDFEEELDAFRETLSPAGQVVFDRVLAQLQERPPRETTVNYSLTKRVEKPWNMLIGTNVQITPHWAIRAELGFLGRFQFFVGPNYRFGAGLRAKRQAKQQAKQPPRAESRTP